MIDSRLDTEYFKFELYLTDPHIQSCTIPLVAIICR